MNETGTYKKLKYNTALLDSSTAADSFYTAKAGSAMELLERVDSIRMSAMPDSVTVDNWNNRSSIADSLSYEAMLIDSILSDTSSTLKQSDIDDYLLQKQLFENFIDSTQALTNSDGVYFKALKDSTITQALLVNSSVTTGNTIEANQKLLNSIYLNTVAVDSVQFDSATLSNLYNLAFQCPYTGGYAVYEARSVLALIKDTFYIDEDICTISYKTDGSEKTVRPKKDTLIEEGITITMYPNPAKDYVLLSFSKQTTNPMQLRITDMIGRRVADVPIIVLGNSYQINTSALSNGIYYVNVYDSKNKLFGDKLSILR